MKILVLNGSPHPKGSTKQMVTAFAEGAVSVGHEVTAIDVGLRVLPYKRSRQLYTTG